MPEEEAMVMELIFGRWRSQTLYGGGKISMSWRFADSSMR